MRNLNAGCDSLWKIGPEGLVANDDFPGKYRVWESLQKVVELIEYRSRSIRGLITCRGNNNGVVKLMNLLKLLLLEGGSPGHGWMDGFHSARRH
jgi:hypothetical protein